MGKLQRVSAQLVELSPEQGAPFQQRWREAEEQYGRIRERVRQAAALLEDALPRYSQVQGQHRRAGVPQGFPSSDQAGPPAPSPADRAHGPAAGVPGAAAEPPAEPALRPW